MSKSKAWLLAAAITLAPSFAHAQEPDPSAGCEVGTPACPKHELVASLSDGAAFESVAAAPDGSLFISDHGKARLFRYTAQGGLELQVDFAAMNLAPAGLVFDADGTLYVSIQKTPVPDGDPFAAGNARTDRKGP